MACILNIRVISSTTGRKIMDQGIYVALSGAKLQELRLQLVANNLANANTTGYKADKVTSRSFIFELEDAFDEQADFKKLRSIENLDQLDEPLKAYNGVYSKTRLVGTNFSQGTHRVTGNPLNISLEGPGFFAIETSGGIRYTRQGDFSLNSDGELVTPDGYNVRGRGLRDLGEGDLTIDAEGNVLLDGKREGRIDVVEFDNPHVLKKEGQNLFVLKAQGDFEKKAENTVVKQGYVENPNINVVTEMVSLIELNRMYESYQKVITSIDQSTSQLFEISRMV